MQIKQAVILCGGYGKRLMPLTKNTPKPMIKINQKPFLFFLLKQLSDNGIKEFLILNGYLGNKISKYFNDGSQFGWKINYSQGPLEWNTAKRIMMAKNQIKKNFLLLYSDNYIHFDIEILKKKFKSSNSIITLHIAKKFKGNIKIIKNSNNFIDYNISRKKTDYNFVEVGYMLVDKERLFNNFVKINNSYNYNFSKILNKLCKRKLISAVNIKGDYNSISDIKRLKITRLFFKVKKIILLDRDGTINKKSTKGRYIEKWQDFVFIRENLKALVKLSKLGFQFIIITNQAGIARKVLTEKNLNFIHTKMQEKLKNKGIIIKDIFVSPDLWGTGSTTRKPAPGLFFAASKKYNLNLSQCIYIGDDIRDCQAAYNAGSNSIFLGKKEEIKLLNKKQYPLGVFKDMYKATNLINKFYK